MTTNTFRAGAVLLVLFVSACAPNHAAAPQPAPTPKQNIVALLPEPDGASTGIVIRNQARSQDLTQPDQAARVERNDVPPSAPFVLDQAEVRRLFGSAFDVVPAAEVLFTLHFDGDSDVRNAADRKSTAITVIGHTDTTAPPAYNYELGRRRAQYVAGWLQSQGVPESDLFVSSHGDADLLVKTDRNIPNAQNRRVEVTVR